MNQSSNSVAQVVERDDANVVAHNDDGTPIHPEDLSTFDQPKYNREDGELYYDEMGRGMDARRFIEPLACVSDKRLRDLYRYEAKRAYTTDKERYEENADWLREFVEARGLDVPDVTEWFVVYLSMTDLETVKQEFTGVWTWANRVDDGEMWEQASDQTWCLRCTREEAEFAADLVDDDPTPIEETDVDLSDN